MPPDRRFHTVTLRAVDQIDAAIAEAARRAEHCILILGTRNAVYPTVPGSFHFAAPIPLPDSETGAIRIADRTP